MDTERSRIRSRLESWDWDPERERAMLLLEVASQYYEYGMSQASIGQASGYSRATVGRLLDEARTRGIVRIQITHPLQRMIDLEISIRRRFGVEHVHVAGTGMLGEPTDEVASACATLLDRLVADDSSIGISNGRIHTALPRYVRRRSTTAVTIVQLVGGLGDHARLMDTPALCRQLASTYGGAAQTLAAPLLAADAHTAQRLRSIATNRRTLAQGRDVDIAVVGVGSGFRHPSGVFQGLLDRDTVRTLHRAGAVGHLLGRFIDNTGRVVSPQLNSRVVGLTLEYLRQIPFVIGLAAGAEKGEAIAAAVRGGYVDALVVDVGAAQALAHLPEIGHRPRTR